MALEDKTKTRAASGPAKAMKTPAKPTAGSTGNNPLEAKKAVSSPKGTGMLNTTAAHGAMKEEQDWQTGADVRTLHAAHLIKSDPARHARAKVHVKQMMAAMKGAPSMPATPVAGSQMDTGGTKALMG